MNAGLIILRVASERRDAQNEHDGAGLRSSVTAATPSQQQLRRSSTTSLQPSTQLVVSSSRPSSRCCWQHLEEGRGGTSRRDASCAQHHLRRSSMQRQQATAVSRDDERSTGALHSKLAAPRGGTWRHLEGGRELCAASVPSQQHQLSRSSSSRRRQCPATLSGRRVEKIIGQPLE